MNRAWMLRRIWIPATITATILAAIAATRFWSWHPATPMLVAGGAYAVVGAVRLAVVLRRRYLRRRLEQHWADITDLFRADQPPRHRVDVTLPLALLAALLTGSAVLGAVVGLVVMALAANRHGLTADDRLLLAAAQPTTEEMP